MGDGGAVANIFAVVFFLMLLSLGVDSMMMSVETVMYVFHSASAIIIPTLSLTI